MLDYLSPVKEVELKAKGGIYVASMSFSTANISRGRSKTKKRVEGGGGEKHECQRCKIPGGVCGCMFPQKFWKLSVSKMAISSKKGNLHLNNFLLYL